MKHRARITTAIVIACAATSMLGSYVSYSNNHTDTDVSNNTTINDSERHLAINDPDKFAWILFSKLNQYIPNDSRNRVVWEKWALARDVFADPNTPPSWAEITKDELIQTKDRFEGEPLQQTIRRTETDTGRLRQPNTKFDPVTSPSGANETRMNRATFDFIVKNNLYYVEGQEEFYRRGEDVVFPLDAIEVKAQWRPIADIVAHKYHNTKTTSPEGKEQLWGLTSLHITTKDLPNWFWATFEHKDNPGRESVVPSVDNAGLPDSLKDTVWENYILRGTQVDFVTPKGQPTILASSQIERGFQDTSSCITCHSRATIGERPRTPSEVNRLEVFEGDSGSIGIPDPTWFVDKSTIPAARKYVQLDFVWSLIRAKRRTTTLGQIGLQPSNTVPRMRPHEIAQREPLRQFKKPQLTVKLVEVSALVRATEARSKYKVTGKGLGVAVFDTGLRATHQDFLGRVLTQVNYTSDNNGSLDNANDDNGHGTHVAGIIAADNLHTGIAPKANIIPIKVLTNSGGGSFDAIEKGLQWVLDNHKQFKISAVNMSLGDGGNYLSENFSSDNIGKLIAALRQNRIAVVVSSGNDFFSHNSNQGMSFPSIYRDTVSVGAVYDAPEGSFTYSSGAHASSSAADRLTPFSQRLHKSVSHKLRTDIFSPGAPVTSSGILSDSGSSIQHGTSQAAPVTTGAILLMQEYYQRETGELPSIDNIEKWMRESAVIINDGDDEDDNVINSGFNYPRLDIVAAIERIQRQLEKDMLISGKALKP